MNPDEVNQNVPSTPVVEPSVDNHTLLGILSYIGPLVIVSFMMGKEIPFVKFHVKQGAVLFAIEVVLWLIGSFLWQFWMLMNILNLAVIILAIIGIVNVVQRQEKPLPIIGHLSKYFKF